jgi:RNA polymerase sigma-70 factor (ECF subfamily)
MLDEVELVALCKKGVLKAFGELIQRHERRLYGTLFHVLHNAEDARDALQDSFLQAYQSLDKFEGRSDFYTWLYRIGINVAITYKRKRRPVASLETGRRDPSADPPDPSNASEPSHAMVRAEQSSLIWKALGRLPKRDRALLVLKDMEGLCYEELAEVLDIPIGTVRSGLHRARLKLWRLLKDLEECNNGPHANGGARR